jgi:DNA-directed RNA polymerase specialized sigma24 family protein
VKNFPETNNPKIEEILRTDNSKSAVWLNYAVKFIKVFYRNDKFKPTAQDVVSDLLLKIYTGERRWEPDKVDLNTFMYNNLRSHVGGLAKKEQRLVSADEYNAEDNSFSHRYAEDYYVSKNEIEITQDRKEEVEIVLRSIKGDELCELVFYCMKDGMGINETAEYLGIGFSEVNNAVRRIKYKAQKVLK